VTEPAPASLNIPGADIAYARFGRRIRAALFDTAIIAALLYGCIISLMWVADQPLAVKIALLLLPFILVEPLMVALTGGTPGHHLTGLKVRDAKQDRKLGFFRACLRGMLKTFLGWLSFLFIFITRRHQALHDYATSSVVVLRTPQAMPAYERIPARNEAIDPWLYPSKTRRTIVIIAYVVAAFFLDVGIEFSAISQSCMLHDHCSAGESAVMMILSLLFWASISFVTFLGWQGRLYGARRRPKSNPED